MAEFDGQVLLVFAVVHVQSAGISKVQKFSVVLDTHGGVVQRADLLALLGQGGGGGSEGQEEQG